LIENILEPTPYAELSNGLTFALAGAGGRGRMFAEWLRTNVCSGAVVAVAEPNADRRNGIAEMHGIPHERRFRTWQEMLDRPKLAEILINTTMDRDHTGSATMALRAGYHMLLEKPMATTLEDCAALDRLRRETNRIVSVCHSLRYNSVYSEIRRILRAGTIGEIVTLDQLEAVEIVHQSHSFVRGNWGNEGRSSFMLLAKSCHDLDIIVDLIDRDCVSAHSFGSLFYFKAENQPIGAPDRCVDGCPVERACPYSALKLYVGDGAWSQHAGFAGLSPAEARERLRVSPYGRCVFKTDNDVVDHQVVSLEFEGGVTATFTMTAFTPTGGRYLRIHGTRGYLEAKIDQRSIDIYEFWANNKRTQITVPEEDGPHGGADSTVIASLIEAVQLSDPESVRTTTTQSLRSHAVAFAAERSRREGRQIELRELLGEGEGI
jgi:predicted dehydrogenase